MGVITGLFPSIGRRTKHKAMPTLEKELDRIVERLTFLENEIVLSADEIQVCERRGDAAAEPMNESEESELEEPRLAPSTGSLGSSADIGRPRVKALPVERSFGKPRQPPQDEPPQSRLAALVALEDFDPDYSSSESSPVSRRLLVLISHHEPLMLTFVGGGASGAPGSEESLEPRQQEPGLGE